MFKQFPDVVVTQECGNVQDTNYDINWEEIARWALEHGELEDNGAQFTPGNTVAQNNGPPIDWERIADSFMRDEAAENAGNSCEASEINESMRAHDHPNVRAELNHPSEGVGRPTIQAYGQFSPVPHRERSRSPEPYRRRVQPANLSYSGNSELNCSMRDSDFNNTSCYDRTPLSSMQDFSFMDASFMHDSTVQSDIMDYLEGGAERNRPNSIAEGYHFPGRAYGRAGDEGKLSEPEIPARTNRDIITDNNRVFTSTPKKKQRTTRAETFEMPDGSKMFNVTLEECLAFGRRLRHISDVRDNQGCQIMHMDREINEEPNGARHRVEIARRWLDLDQDQEGAGCS